MAAKKQLAVMLVLALVVVAVAEKVCNVEQTSLLACRSYCKTGSDESSPSQDCCDKLRDANVGCLCGYKNRFRRYGFDPNRAMQIPSKCGFGSANPCG